MPTLPRNRTRTALGRRIERALTALNDQDRFFLFLESEFIGQIKNSDPRALKRFTTEAFPTNPYASWIHVPLERLPAFQQAHRGATFAAYFSSSYEIASSFVDEATRTLRATNASSLVVPSRLRDGPEEFYQRTLAASAYPMPAVEVIQTLTYFRYRRNAAVHLSTTPKASYSALARQSGTALNTFWARANVQIDFQNANTGLMSERETLDALKLLRIMVQRLDEHFSSVLDGPGAARVEASHLFGAKRVRLNVQVIEERVRKLRVLLSRDYGLAVSSTDLAAAVRAANPR